MKRGLYVHIPFCRKKCHYCNFVITLNHRGDLKEVFLSSTEKEINHTVSQYGRLTFDTLYLGGGTPSMLSVAEMARLLELLRTNFHFKSDPEITLEMNPEDADPEKLNEFHKLGINRVSLGVQSFNDELLEKMGRCHSVSDTVRAFHLIHTAGFKNLNLDLIIDLPGQTLEDVRRSLAMICGLNPQHVSIYDLDVHPDSVFGSIQKSGKLEIPDEESHSVMAQAVEEMLEEAGYIHYELLNYAKPGFESRHNLIYWHNQEYLGLGPGAFSYLRGVRYQFASTVDRYFKKCKTDDWANDVEDALIDEKKEIETLLTGLRLKEGLSLDSFKIILPRLQSKLNRLIPEGMIEQHSGHIRLTDRGRFLANSVFLELVGDDKNA